MSLAELLLVIFSILELISPAPLPPDVPTPHASQVALANSTLPVAPDAPLVTASPPRETPLQTAAVALRKALVNIICLVPTDSSLLYSISGSAASLTRRVLF